MWTAERIRRLRQQMGMTQEEFAAEVRISVYTIRDWEQGRYVASGPATRCFEVFQQDPLRYGKAHLAAS